MFGQIVAQRMQLRGHRAEQRGWPTRDRHMHFLTADINKGCTRIQHRQLTHSSPHVLLLSILVGTPANTQPELSDSKRPKREGKSSPNDPIASDRSKHPG